MMASFMILKRKKYKSDITTAQTKQWSNLSLSQFKLLTNLLSELNFSKLNYLLLKKLIPN